MSVITHLNPAAPDKSPTTGECRGFLQERLAYLGKVYASIGISFYVAGNLAAAAFHGSFPRSLTEPASWIVPAACLIYCAQWLLCRRDGRPQASLRAIDTVATTLAALLHSLMVFKAIPGEMAAMSYMRALLLVSFGLLVRAIVVPSSSVRTLLLGLPAVGVTALTGFFWYSAQPSMGVSASLQTVLTAMWILGAVVIATVASHVIFGLRRQVHEARRLGQYTLVEKIGEGGMGTVYRASHAMLRRPTAVKLLADGADSERVGRFEREVQLTSQLTHPNTITIFDYGRTPDGVFYYAMEYLDGVNLEDLVRIDGPQPASRVVHIIRQVAASLTEAHGIGLVHRDIKPSNVILVGERGGATDVAKVVDFGLVKDLDAVVGVTREGRIAGTPHYLAPEVMMSPAHAGPQSDLYSLGCVGYYLLTGTRVFEARTLIEVFGLHVRSTPVAPGERLGRPVPASLSAILMACLEKKPGRRPASAQALVDLLDGCRDVEPWTRDMARAWWHVHGPKVLERKRDGQQTAADRKSITAIPTAAA